MIKSFCLFLNLIFITLSIYLGINTFYKILTSNLLIANSSQTTHKQIPIPAKFKFSSVKNYSSIAERNIFNTVNKKNEANQNPIKTEDLKTTELNLKLKGTIIGFNRQDWAIIEDTKSKKQDIYKTKDTIQGAIIESILKETLILEVNGKKEILKMENSLAQINMPEQKKWEFDHGYLQNQANFVHKLMDQIQVEEYYNNNNKPAGAIVKNIKEGSIFEEIGMQAGDVIVEVNGKEIQVISDVLEVYQTLWEEPKAEIKILRQGRYEFVYYSK
ncbi:MAG: PDZ domain-containing protein [Desulfobacterales bacterium]|nr:PDZ domain-containing protein [Desulfobacterales bacterium]